MASSTTQEELIHQLTQVARLDNREAERVLDEVLSYFNESVEMFVTRRHSELRASGLANAEVYEQISIEVATRRFAAPELSQRQIRRLVYG